MEIMGVAGLKLLPNVLPVIGAELMATCCPEGYAPAGAVNFSPSIAEPGWLTVIVPPSADMDPCAAGVIVPVLIVPWTGSLAFADGAGAVTPVIGLPDCIITKIPAMMTTAIIAPMMIHFVDAPGFSGLAGPGAGGTC